MCWIIQYTCILIQEVFILSFRYWLAMEKDAKWARWKQHRPKIQEQKEINELCQFVQTSSCFCFHNRIYACDQPGVTTRIFHFWHCTGRWQFFEAESCELSTGQLLTFWHWFACQKSYHHRNLMKSKSRLTVKYQNRLQSECLRKDWYY